MYGIVYSIEHMKSGKMYIGQTTIDRPSQRFTEHKGCAQSGVKHPLYNAIRKHGVENFEFLIVDEANDQVELDYLEAFYIDRFETVVSKGYNLRLGGSSGGKLSEEAKQKIKQAWVNPITRENFLRGRRSDIAKQRYSQATKLTWENPRIRALRELSSHDPNVNTKRSASLKLTLATAESKLVKRLVRLGTRYITDGITNQIVGSKDQVPEGWRYGRIYINVGAKEKVMSGVSSRHAGSRWITNGIMNSRN